MTTVSLTTSPVETTEKSIFSLPVAWKDSIVSTASKVSNLIANFFSNIFTSVVDAFHHASTTILAKLHIIHLDASVINNESILPTELNTEVAAQDTAVAESVKPEEIIAASSVAQETCVTESSIQPKAVDDAIVSTQTPNAENTPVAEKTTLDTTAQQVAEREKVEETSTSPQEHSDEIYSAAAPTASRWTARKVAIAAGTVGLAAMAYGLHYYYNSSSYNGSSIFNTTAANSTQP